MDLTSNKLRLMSAQFLSKFQHTIILKRNYKHVHSLRIQTNHEEKNELKILPKLKYITAIHREYGIARNTPPPKLPLYQKLVKRHRKYLRCIKGHLQDSSIQRLLPLLSDLSLGLSNQEGARWRLLGSQSAFRRLIFALDSFKMTKVTRENSHKSSWENGLKEYEKDIKDFLSKENKRNSAVRRSLPKMKDLVSLEIKLPNMNPELILSVLKFISEKVPVNSLEHFGFHIYSSYGNVQKKPINQNGPLSFITKHFANLSGLCVTFAQHSEFWDPRNLAQFDQFLRLKRMNLVVAAHSFETKDDFFEHFTIPSTLEHFDLRLQDFGWNEASSEAFKNDPIYKGFFVRLQKNGQRLRILNIRVDPFLRSGSIKGKFSGFLKPSADFARLFIKQLTRLEQLSYEYHGTTDIEEENHLEMKDFWRALVSSKETLQSVYIFSPPTIFPESVNDFELRFPRLQELRIAGALFPFTVLGPFCQGFASLENVKFEAVYFFDKKWLECFLDSWLVVPQKMSFEAKIYFSRDFSMPFVVDCLKKFVSEANIQGDFNMKVYMAEQERSLLQGLFELVKKRKDNKLSVDYNDVWLSLSCRISSD